VRSNALAIGLSLVVLKFSASAWAQQENFTSTLARIQSSYWTGQWTVSGIPFCSGPLKIMFFPMRKESFAGGDPTVSYRHFADVSQTPFFCEKPVGHFSPVDFGECGDYFPAKRSPLEGDKRVPFRTIISKNGGRRAVISSPSCRNGRVERRTPNLEELELSPDGNTLLVTIRLREERSHFVLAEFTYELHRVKSVRFRDHGRTRIGVDNDGVEPLARQP
jgi:hypothetical protein